MNAAAQNTQNNLADVLREFPIPGYVVDIKQLMATWKNLPDATLRFAAFRKIWEDMQFNFIYSSAPENINPTDWFAMLVDSAFGYMFVNSFRVRLGAFYFLYMLWMAQREPKLSVRISIEMWNKLIKMMNEEVVQNSLKDAAVIFRRMRDGRAFNFVAQARIVLPPSVVAGTTSLKKDVRSWDPSEQLGSVMTTRFETEEFHEVMTQYIKARAEVEKLDGTTLAQPQPEELEALFQSLQNANYVSTAGLTSHYPYQEAPDAQAAPQQQQRQHNQGADDLGNAMEVDGVVYDLQGQEQPRISEGPAEMHSDDDRQFNSIDSPVAD